MLSRKFTLLGAAAIFVAAALAWWLRPVPPEGMATVHVAPSPVKPLAAGPAPDSAPVTAHFAGTPASAAVSFAPPPERLAATAAAEPRRIDEHLRRQHEQDLGRWYEDIGAALGLGEDENFALIRTLTEHAVQLMEMPYDGGVAAVQRAHELRQSQREHLREMLGPKRLASLDEYLKTIGARIEVQELARFHEFTRAKPPISDEQRRRLVRAAIDAGAYFDNPVFTGADSPGALTQEWLAKMEQRDAKMLGAVRRVLGAEYVERVQTHQDGRRNAYEKMLREQP